MNPQSNMIDSDFQHRDKYIFADDDAFVFPAGDYLHQGSSLNGYSE